MSDSESRPSPEELLKRVQEEERREQLGSLKLFFGMAAGVGKTYSMLEEAQQKLREGVDVVVASINTHGRRETQKLLRGLPIIPQRWVRYQDLLFEEMDLEAILKRRPQVVLVDELAHTNVPGSKHAKRWQDVLEILNAGIDVHATLNVQHVESRKELVESVTGISVRETVPDLILERATSIELVDIPPRELLQRLQEGKVYLGDQSKLAAKNFFREENLIALREIALRLTAEKVEHDLHGVLKGRGWKAGSRLMVLVDVAPSTEQLIRAARRMAFESDSPWSALYVDTGKSLTDGEQTSLHRHLNLARDLGAEVITTYDTDVARAVERIAKQKDVTRLVMSRSPKRRRLLQNPFKPTLADSLQHRNRQIDITILGEETPSKTDRNWRASLYRFSSSWKSYLVVLPVWMALNLIGFVALPLIGYRSVGFIFLLGILALGLFVGLGPIFLAAALSALCWDLLFMPPVGRIKLSDPEDAIFMVVYFVVAAFLGAMTSRMRQQDRFLQKSQETTERLYEIERDIVEARDPQQLRLNVCSHLQSYFPGKFDLLIRGLDRQLIFDSPLPLLKIERERQTAAWVLQNSKIAGWSTETLPSAEAIYFPLTIFKTTMGVLVYYSKRKRPLSIDEMNFIQIVSQQIAIYLERNAAEERVGKQEYGDRVEKMHRSIFHTLNRSFYGPIEGVIKINHQLQEEEVSSTVRSLLEQMDLLINKIKVAIDNVATMSKFESGWMPLGRKKKGSHTLRELIDQSLGELKPFSVDRMVETKVASDQTLLPAPFDFNLMNLLLKNLVLNALEHADPTSKITVGLEVAARTFRMSVSDEGPGIPDEIVALIEDKSYRPSEEIKGLGLGLAIVRAVADFYGGKIDIKKRAQGGTLISLVFPF
jgi:two-component system, OmpR family, sensor histidine kinase KdpD